MRGEKREVTILWFDLAVLKLSEYQSGVYELFVDSL